MSADLRNKIIVLLGVLGVSFSAILVKIATAPSLVLVFYRIGFAALLMTLPGLRSLKIEWSQITKKDLICCVISGIFLALHFNSYFTAVKLSSIASAIVLVDTEVFFVSFVYVFVFHRMLKKKNWFGIVITFLGSVIIALGDASGTGGGTLIGDLWALSGAVFVSVYTIMGLMCREHMSTGSYTTIVYWTTTLTALLLLLVQGIPVTGYSSINLLSAFGMTILCTLLGHSVFSWALKYVSPSFISTAKLLEPVFSSILGIFFFMEIPSLTAIVGGIIIIAGIYLAGQES